MFMGENELLQRTSSLVTLDLSIYVRPSTASTAVILLYILHVVHCILLHCDAEEAEREFITLETKDHCYDKNNNDVDSKALLHFHW